MKKRLRRSGETLSSRAPDSAQPAPRASARSSMSVAKICTRGTAVSLSICSRSSIAIENTSSPVAQPGTQMRTVSSAPRPSNSFGMTEVGERLERIVVAEEIRDVDEQVAKQGADLLRLLPQPLDIGFDRRELRHLHAPLHPAHECLGLVAAEIVADLIAQDAVDFRQGLLDRLIRRRPVSDAIRSSARAGELARTNSTSLAPISSTGMAKSTKPVEMALSGMSGCWGPKPSPTCAKVIPPRSLIALMPSVPSASRRRE